MCGSAEDEAEELLFPPSAVEAVGELGEVAGHVFPAHAMKRSAQPGLEVAEDPMHPGQDLGRSGGRSVDPPFVLDADLGETGDARAERVRSRDAR
jgi:hypothetical protein